MIGMPIRLGSYGKNHLEEKQTSPRTRLAQEHAVYSQNTNVLPAFGNAYKIARNRRLTGSVMRYNYGMDKIGSGEKVVETTSDPLKRDPKYIIQAARIEASIAGRTRGYIRPAAPGQVRWKNPYWVAERPPVRQPIGPFIQGSLERQSVLYRLSDAFSAFSGGG